MNGNDTSLPPLNWLRAFESAARHLSFTSAAADLNMTQSAVSQQIKNLEHYLGRTLFIRRTRSIVMTDAGYAYLPVVQEAFETLATGTRMMTGGDRGAILSVQCNIAFSVFWLAPRLGKLFAKYPWLKLNISTVFWDPEAPSSDVEIRFGTNADRHPGAKRLGRNTSFPVCTPEFARTLDGWQNANLFDCTGVRANWESWARHRNESLPRGKQINLATTYCVSLQAALGSVGLALGHEVLVNDLLDEGRLIRPYDEAVDMDETYYLIEPPDHARTQATAAFTDWILQEMTASG